MARLGRSQPFPWKQRRILVAAAAGTTVTPGTGSLILTGYAPVLDIGLTPSTGSLVLTGYAPVLDLKLTPSTGSLVLTGFAPTVAVNTPLTPGAASLTLTGYAPTVTATETTATPPTRRVVVRPPARRWVLAGSSVGDTYTDPAGVRWDQRVAASAEATAYTEPAAGYIRTSEPARAGTRAHLTGAAYDQGEFSASVVLVDDDIEALVLLGVL